MAKTRAPELDEDEIQLVYNWVDEIPLSRPKRNISRDFSDGVLMAEVVNYFVPKLVELHNYNLAHSEKNKLYNWQTLNQKVMKKLNYQISKADINAMILCEPYAVERVLRQLQGKIAKYLDKRTKTPKTMAGHDVMSKNDFVKDIQQHVEDLNLNDNDINPGNEILESELIKERDETIQELRETIMLMEVKMKKLEQLVKMKDNKITDLQNRLEHAGIDS